MQQIYAGYNILKKCLKCGEEFYTSSTEIKNGRGEYCSKRCLIESKRKYKKCKLCGMDFYSVNKNKKFCSKFCFSLWQKRNYKNGNSIKDKIRGLYKYTKWRMEVKIKDDFTCQECGLKGNFLQVHHSKKSFFKLLKEIKVNLPLYDLYEGAKKYTPLWDISNGITLCKKCHIELHKKGGLI